MVARAGTYRNGELWLRCPFCGDSPTHLRKAHFSVNSRGLYHCVRCGAGGRLPLKRVVGLLTSAGVFDLSLEEELTDEEEWGNLYRSLLPGPGSSRRSGLDRFHGYHPSTRERLDVFLSRDLGGDVRGLAYSVQGRRERKVLGDKVLGWKGTELLSTPGDPLRVVEGPYDVIGPRDVCTFGFVGSSALRILRGHFVILCPDGDVWEDDRKRRRFIKSIQQRRSGWASIVGVEVLPDGKDPDEVPYHKRELYSLEEVCTFTS